MDLGIVAQGLVVPHALHGLGDGLFVEDPPVIDVHGKVEALQDQAFQDLGLHLAHQTDLDLLQSGVPAQAQHRVLVLKLPQPGEDLTRIDADGQDQTVAHHRLQNRGTGGGLEAEALSVLGSGQPDGGADLAREDLVCGGEFPAVVAPELGQLFLPPGAVQNVPDPQDAARDLHVGQPVALRVVRDLKDPCSEFRDFRLGRQQGGECVQKGLHAVETQTGAEEAGEDLPAGCQLAEAPFADRSGRKIFVHHGLAAHCGLLVPRFVVRGEVDAAVSQLRAQILHQLRAAPAGEIHLGHEEEDRNLIVLQQPPEGPRVGLYPVGPADDQNRAVEHAQHPLGLGGKVHVARRVEQGQLPVAV